MRIELIPRERRWKLKRRAAMATWASGLALFALMGTTWIAVAATGVGSPATIEKQAADLSARLRLARRTESATQAQLSAAMMSLEANRAASSQLDWGRLLSAVTRATDDDVVLGRFRLSGARAAREADSGSTATIRAGVGPDRSSGIRLVLEGYGRTSQAVSSYVLSLEGTRLFDQVRQVDTRREPIASGTVIAFRIECLVLDEEEAGP